LCLSLGLGLTASAAAQAPKSDAQIEDDIRNAIQRMPYYGVFDLIAFEVKKIPGVKGVTNKIEILPVSLEDDRIRWEVFRAIYTDAFLSKYGTPITGVGGSPMWGRHLWGPRFGSWPGFRTGPWSHAPFFGMEPIGNYAIHIIVNRGVVSLYGTVSNDVDKTKAGLDARAVFGVRSVDNQIQVSPG
jgi:hypothetical protein